MAINCLAQWQQQNYDRWIACCRQKLVIYEAPKYTKTRMWANAQRDGCPAEYRWCPLFNAAKFGWRPLLECRAVTLPRRKSRWNLQGCLKLANGSQPLSGPQFTILWWRVGEVSMFNKFFLIVDTCLSCEDIARQSCVMVPKWRFFCVLYFQWAACSTFQTCIPNLH